MDLARRLALTIGAVLALAVGASVATLVIATETRDLMASMVDENMASVRAAEELEIALLDQRGLVANYILDGGDERWLQALAAREPAFHRWLGEARRTATTASEDSLIGQLAVVYAEFDARRDEVVGLYRAGDELVARRLLLYDVGKLYERAYDLCEAYLSANERAIEQRTETGSARLDRLRWVAFAYTALVCALGALVIVFMFRRILRPLRMLADAAGAPRTEDAVRDVGVHMQSLMDDVDETRGHLERSRQQLLTSERLASLGKLAASVAHEIRNPLTSMKMRLFYLRGEIGSDPLYEDDFRVVAEEVDRLEAVVRNFLEFSRPPDPAPQLHAVEELLELTLELCGPRLEGRAVDVVREPHPPLPAVWVDADQTKQVFLNLVLNAMEAMPEGGRLSLRLAADDGSVGVDFVDTGVGMSEEVRQRIFEPFFSTKEEGTGLGLSIAYRIMERQGGDLRLLSTSTQGTAFRVTLPEARSDHGDDPRR